MSKKTTLESAHFHINNGGLTFSVVERLDTRKDCPVYPPGWDHSQRERGPDDPEPPVFPTETHYNRSWVFRVETNQFGSGVSFSFPLVPLMVRWTLGALERVLARMEAPQDRPTDGPEFAFRNLDHCSISARDGQQVMDHWPFTPKLVSNSTSE